MIIDRYRAVFTNIYLATKIYNTVHQIQIDRFPLKYHDIIDVGWMLKYGHVGLVREKIKRNEYLYNKYYALEYYDKGFDVVFEKLVNVDVVKYLFENGYARDLTILDYINKNNWQCFTKKALNKNYVHAWYIEIPFRMRIWESRRPSPINIPLVEYLIKEKYISFEKVKKIYRYLEPFFGGNDVNCILQEEFWFHEFVYLIYHNNYFSIDPFMNLLTNDSFDCWLNYFEYIYRNQHKFQTKP
ncbi:hypothetical protein CYY_005409 [Polysphondylium violaceum]|uniref:Uncharacterized protein n=1 Tax=Polysphondylium violaceum TaxID=133409 RepID=A0A8J4PUA1_9MYCE|nr:hypothetical protein CYY_005409 [Polysphondylium violaceum]